MYTADMSSSVEITSAVRVGPMTQADWPAVRDIYSAGIAGGNATFEAVAPEWAAWDAQHLGRHRLVARSGAGVLGWAAVSPVSERCAYAGVVEDSVYVRPDAHGRGVGRMLLEALTAETDAAGIWTVQAGIFPENVASVELHRRCGFRVVGTRERLGQLGGRWRDVVLMERRRP